MVLRGKGLWKYLQRPNLDMETVPTTPGKEISNLNDDTVNVEAERSNKDMAPVYFLISIHLTFKAAVRR